MDFGDLCGAINSQFRCASLDRVTPHTFRDTYASRLVQAGVSLVKVQKLLEHSSPNMTQKYAHLSPDATGQEAAAVLDGLRD
ncbi:tyrosine-type recombinase/integrase [Paraburkholderia bryophila]|uniref:tyrosine-type recombinase/integrase n=1 Tax=Paraburkholderia bryophila TaxID=420952 RepID=UPI00234AC1E4|nr:tyrosine-type recombinase/integrase [Paraburkholderia bryophila]WCM20424.1 tyrosine-type recombinase/integrase [Paraburkholderia bryophila]